MKDLSGRVFGTDLEIRQDARERNIFVSESIPQLRGAACILCCSDPGEGAGKRGMRARRVLACARRWSRVREKPRDSVEMIGKSGEKARRKGEVEEEEEEEEGGSFSLTPGYVRLFTSSLREIAGTTSREV